MSIDPHSALTLAAVADAGTLEKAAQDLHITPSAVSQRLKLLEQQLGQRVLVRTRPVRITEAGEAIVRFARRYALLEHEAEAALGLDGRGAAPRLTLAVNSDSLATWFLGAIAQFTSAHAAQVEVVREDQDETAQLLASGVAIAAVTSVSTPSPGCSVTALGSLSYEAMAATSWWERWVGEGGAALTPEILSIAPRVDFDRTDELQAQWLRARGVDPGVSPAHHVPSTHDLARAVELGLGWGMLLSEQAEDLRRRGAGVPLGGDVLTTPLFWQVSRTPSVLLDALTGAVTAVARDTLRQPGGQ
jgi:LysR family transcriptional regulator, chromosome initiation inhibitor